MRGKAARLEGVQEPAEDDPQAQPCERIVLPDLLPERARDTVLEAVEMTKRGWRGAWIAGLAGQHVASDLAPLNHSCLV